MSGPKTEVLPGGITIASGGTRLCVNIDRPWQTEIQVNPATCPFESNDVDAEVELEAGAGWRVLRNRYTPFSWHKLIIPAECWPAEKLRLLGGPDCIAAALAITRAMISDSDEEIWLGVHIGPSAGQNICHLHYHLLRPMQTIHKGDPDADVIDYCRSSSRIIFEDPNCVVVAGGCRAGQCFFIPRPGESDNPPDIASTICRTIELYNRKFKSKQGLLPDYALGLTFRKGIFRYGAYVPALNNWGFTEFLGLIETRPLILPWPHEETVRYLSVE
jgi:diadenosine tetraphosphate (Ap4A) HIT family hydrolase